MILCQQIFWKLPSGVVFLVFRLFDSRYFGCGPPEATSCFHGLLNVPTTGQPLYMPDNLPDLKSTIKITNLYRRPPRTPKSMKMDQIMKGHVRKFWGRVFCQRKKPCGRTLGHKGLAKHNEVIQDHENASSDSLKPFSDSYSTIWPDSYGKINGIATRSQ